MNKTLQKIFERLIDNTFNENDFKTLSNIIKRFLGFPPRQFVRDNIDDIVQDVIQSLLISLKNSGTDIDNPEAYLRTIVRNNSERYEPFHQETLTLIRNIREILSELENEGILNSYNNRKYCLSNFTQPGYSVEDVLNFAVFYDFTEINSEARWTQRKKQLLKEFIVALLNDIKCIEFSRLIELLKIKMGLVMTRQDYEGYDDSNDNETEIFEMDISVENQQENQNIIDEYIDLYRKKLERFLNTANDEAKFIISIIYFYHIEEKSLNQIARRFGYNSPSTIQLYLTQNHSLTPNGFLKTLSLIDEKIQNHFVFVEELLNGFKEVLIDVYNQITQNDNNT